MIRRSAIQAILLTSWVGQGCSAGATSRSDDDTAASTGEQTSAPEPLLYAPVVEWERYEYDGFPVRQYIPPEPKGLVFVYHGSSGDIGFVNKIETVATLNALIVAGIGFVATESDDRTTEKWDVSTSSLEDNADLTRLDGLYQNVMDTTEISKVTPIFALGFSNGGVFSGVFGLAALDQGWPIAAVFPHMSGCASCFGSPIPTAFVEALNDPRFGVEEVVSEHLDRGIPAKHFLVPEQLVHPLYFTKNPTVTDGRSQNAYDDLVALQLIDPDGHRTVPTEDAEQWTEWYANNGTVFGASFRAEELKVAWALHRMNAFYALEVRDFALDQL